MLHGAGLCPDLRHRNQGTVEKIQRQRPQCIGSRFNLPPVVGSDVAQPEICRINVRSSDQYSPRKLHIGHLQREIADGNPGLCRGEGKVQRNGRFPHGGTARQHHQLSAAPTACNTVEVRQSGRDAHTFATKGDDLPPFEIVDCLCQHLLYGTHLVGSGREVGDTLHLLPRPFQHLVRITSGLYAGGQLTGVKQHVPPTFQVCQCLCMVEHLYARPDRLCEPDNSVGRDTGGLLRRRWHVAAHTRTAS